MREKKFSLSGQHVLVIGLGASGVSAAHFLLKRGAAVAAVDQNRQLIQSDSKIHQLRQQGASILHESELCSLAEFDLVVVSPGVPPTQKQICEAVSRGVPIIGEVELGCREIQAPCLGVTGTNGKTTVTLMTAHILNQAGIKTASIGNVGTPVTAVVDSSEPYSIYVIELSSFQLETAHSPFLDHGVILNITPDHLDRYESMEAYARAKLQIAPLIKSGKLFAEQRCAADFSSLFNKLQPVYTYGYADEFVHTDTQKLYRQGMAPLDLPKAYQGRRSHDLENIMAVYCLCCEMGLSQNAFFEGLQTFKKPAHRLEFVRTRAGVNYYDDSKGTNIDAVVRAIETIQEPVILIAGGVDKGFPYSPWIAPFKEKVKRIYAIGEAAEKIRNSLQGHLSVELCATLEEAVVRASASAQTGDAVLLSPGCSSFDMFKDYAHRGNEFQRLVHAL